MRLEQIPIIFGAIVALLGLVLIGDAFVADRGGPPLGERRRRARAERDRLGEGIVGLGLLALAAALVGRDTWRWGTVAVIAGGILLLTGAALNHRFLRELLLFRGPARRQPERTPRGTEVVKHMDDDAPADVPADAPAPAPGPPTSVPESPAAERSATERFAEEKPVEHPADRTAGRAGGAPPPDGPPRLRIR